MLQKTEYWEDNYHESTGLPEPTGPDRRPAGGAVQAAHGNRQKRGGLQEGAQHPRPGGQPGAGHPLPGHGRVRRGAPGVHQNPLLHPAGAEPGLPGKSSEYRRVEAVPGYSGFGGEQRRIPLPGRGGLSGGGGGLLPDRLRQDVPPAPDPLLRTLRRRVPGGGERHVPLRHPAP